MAVLMPRRSRELKWNRRGDRMIAAPFSFVEPTPAGADLDATLTQ